MLSFHVKFVQTDKRTDGQMDKQTKVKQYAPDLPMQKYNMHVYIQINTSLWKKVLNAQICLGRPI